ncbi:hypothetical protein T492DRAFT_1003923, partial [Pavlovales sp. CCMP2436]
MREWYAPAPAHRLYCIFTTTHTSPFPPRAPPKSRAPHELFIVMLTHTLTMPPSRTQPLHPHGPGRHPVRQRLLGALLPRARHPA